MFIKQVGERVVLINDEMEVVKQFENAKIKVDSRVKVVSKSNEENVLCDMPLENTAILYN